MRFLILFCLLLSTPAFAATHYCGDTAKNLEGPINDYFKRMTVRLIPTVLSDIRNFYRNTGVELKPEQMELKEFPVEIRQDASDSISATWLWPQVLVHVGDQTETLFAPMSEKISLNVRLRGTTQIDPESGEVCVIVSEANPKYSRVDYIKMESNAKVMTEMFLDNPDFKHQVKFPAGS